MTIRDDVKENDPLSQREPCIACGQRTPGRGEKGPLSRRKDTPVEIVIEQDSRLDARNILEFFHGIFPDLFIRDPFTPLGVGGTPDDTSHGAGQRSLAEVKEIIHAGFFHLPDRSSLLFPTWCGSSTTEEWPVREAERLASGVFDILGEAEGAVHGTTPDEVHFHEVGTRENINNVCACALGVSALRKKFVNVGLFYRAPVLTGRGTILCAHGELPLPAPATRWIVERCGIIWEHGDSAIEGITPTGAALIAAITGGKSRPRTSLQPRETPCNPESLTATPRNSL